MQEAAKSDQIILEIFSDYVCPFCRLAEPAVRELEQNEPKVRVVWREFKLRPDPASTLDPQERYLTRVWREVVYPMAERMGMLLRLPPVQPSSHLAH